MAASVAYIINDLVDTKQDGLHPFKKQRPLASGQVKTVAALAMLLILLLLTAVFVFKFIPELNLLISGYLILNLFYSLLIKNWPIFDILTIPVFYLFRIAAGAWPVAIQPSGWLVLCTIFLALFLIIGKRKAESNYNDHRSVLKHYPPQLLDQLLLISLTLALISYSIYTVLVLKSLPAILSIFFVMLGLFRYLSLTHQPTKIEYIEKIIFSDKIIAISIFFWVINIYLVLYK